jgi:rare lipoprotein A
MHVLPATAAPGDALSTRLAAKKAQAVRVHKQMDAARTQLAANMAQYQQLTAQLDQTRQEIVDISNQLDLIRAALANDQGQLNQLAVHAYESDSFDSLSVMMGTTSFEDFLTRVDFLARIGRYQSSVIDGVKNQRDQATSLETSLQAQDAHLILLRGKADAERIKIQGDMVRQQALLNSLGADIAKLVKLIEQAAAAAASGQRWDPNAGGMSWVRLSSLLPGAYATVDGQSGYLIPKGVATAYKSEGISFDWQSSWYGNAENGTGTSSGRPYNQEEMTCANKELPLGTLLAVSRGSSHVIVLVTDRGPYIAGRSLDLSHAAASALGIDGVGAVHAEIVVPK